MAGRPEPVVADNASASRYELRLGERLVGTLDYVRRDDALVLAHVGVDPDFRRRGFGSRLLAGALDDIRTRGLSAVPACPFAAWYVRRHTEYDDLVAPPPARGRRQGVDRASTASRRRR